MNYDSGTGKYYFDGGTSQTTANNNNKFKYDSWSTPSTNSTFWNNLSNTSTHKATPLEDGWVKLEWDRMGLALSYLNLFTNKAAVELNPSTQYTLILETRNFSSDLVNMGLFYVARTAVSDTTFTTALNVTLAQMQSNPIFKNILTTSDAATMASSSHALRTFLVLPADSKGSFEARLMIVQGDYRSININYELYGIRPSPTYQSRLKNTYPSGMYSVKANNETYMFYLEDDLRSVQNGTSDRVWIDTSTDQISIERKVGKATFNGTESWLGIINNYSNAMCLYLPKTTFETIFGDSPKANSYIYSTHLPYTNLGQATYRNRVGESVYGYPDASASFMITTQQVLTVNDWKAWLGTNQFTMYYELAVPTFEQVERK